MSVIERLERIFRDVFDDETLSITPETSSEDIEDWDSLAHISIISALQDEFGLELSIAEIAEAADIRAMLTLIDRKTAAL